jgi:hypothetical protein
VYVGDGHQREAGAPNIVVATIEKHVAGYYLLQHGQAGGDNLTKLELNSDHMEIKDMVIGRMRNGAGNIINDLDGVYFITETAKGERMLSFSSFPVRGRQRHKTFFAAPGGPTSGDFTCLRALSEDPMRGVTGIYLGGQGLYHLPASKQGMDTKEFEFSLIADRTTAKNVKNIAVCEDAGNVTLWAHTVDGLMLNVDGDKATTLSTETSAMVPQKWRAPIAILRDVKEWAPIRNRIKRTNDVMVVLRNNALTHKIQDPATHAWTSYDVPLDDSKLMQTFESYTTRLTFRDGSGNASSGVAYEVCASEWCEVTANGKAIELDSEVPVKVETDIRGVITIIARPDTVSAPILRVKVGSQWVEVDPGQKVQSELEKLDTPEKLLAAERHDGKPLVPKDHGRTADELGSMVNGLNGLHKMKLLLPSDGTTKDDYLSGVDLLASGLPEIWGMSIGPGCVQYYSGDEVTAAMADGVAAGSEWWYSALSRAAGHVLEWLASAAQGVVNFVVKKIGDAWDLAVKIAGEAFRFTITCLGHIYRGINWVLKAVVGVDLEDLRKFAGFLFSLDDIRRTHKVLSNIVRQTFPFGASKIEIVNKKLQTGIQWLEDNVDKLGQAPGGHGGADLNAQRDRAIGRLPGDQKELLARQDSPVTGFFTEKFSDSRVLASEPANGLAALKVSAALQEAMDQIQKLGAGYVKQFAAMGEALTGFFKGDITLDKLALVLGKEVIKGLLQVLKGIASVVAAVMREILQYVEDALTADAQIPLISALYTAFIGSEKVSYLDLLLFPFSATATTLYKLTAGIAPFATGTGGLDELGHVELFQRLLGGPEATLNSGNLKELGYVLDYGATVSGLLAHLADMAGTLVSGKRPAFAGGVFSVLGIVFTIPIGKWHRKDVAIGWISRWVGLAETAYNLVFPAELVVSAFIKGLIGVFGLIPTGLGCYINISEAGGVEWKVGMAVLGGINGLITSCLEVLLGVTSCIPPGQAIKESLLLMVAAGIAFEFGSGLAVTTVTLLCDRPGGSESPMDAPEHGSLWA